MSVKTPICPKNLWGKKLTPPEPSEEVAAFARNRRNLFRLAFLFSSFAGLAIPLLVSFPLAFIVLIFAAVAACAIGKVEWTPIAQLLFHKRQQVSDDPLLEKVQARWRQVEEEAKRLEKQYDREVAIGRWGAKRDELRNRKETYENLAQIRQVRLQQLETEARKSQLDEFLDQFEINSAEIKGIGPTIKTTLLSHGVETAADVIEDVTLIPSIGQWRSEKLLEWRRDLERKFDFDPARGVPQEARIKTVREVDALRFRLENELISGAHYLRRMKQEIEASGQKLQPILTQARQELAQAEKDLQVASRRKPPAVILTALIIAFLIGWAIRQRPASPVTSVPAIETSREGSASQASSNSQPVDETSKILQSRDFYRKWAGLVKEKDFNQAFTYLLSAVKTDPKFGPSTDLDKMLYQIKMNGKDSGLAHGVIQDPSFKSYHGLAKLHFEAENWKGATLAFRLAIELRDPSSWTDEYGDAYYHLGLSLAKAGDLHGEIQALKWYAMGPDNYLINHFELATMYLCAGRREAAEEEHRMLENSNPALARALLKLMKKHGKPA